AVFVDADFLFFDDIAKLLTEARVGPAVHVVKHGPLDQRGLKMDAQLQQPYFRKNWSSFVLWNCGHPSNQRLTPYQVNRMTGQWLHAFSWLDDGEIGELPARWNHLVGVDAPLERGKPAAAHFTLGIPSMAGHENQEFADDWRSVASRL
ncbi:MAG: glycosyltransferase, partial [Bradyrhizobium sp.]|nr:glycosyltransferase [Bradyrhizobium sp.]